MPLILGLVSFANSLLGICPKVEPTGPVCRPLMLVLLFSGNILSNLSAGMGWFFIAAANIFLVYTVYLFFSKFGSIRLGGKDAEPEFSTTAWFSMLFSAGMGIGLVFWSVGEPMWLLLDLLVFLV